MYVFQSGFISTYICTSHAVFMQVITFVLHFVCTVFTRLETGGGGGIYLLKLILQTRLLIVTRLVNEA